LKNNFQGKRSVRQKIYPVTLQKTESCPGNPDG